MRPRGTGSIYRQRGSRNWSIKFYRNGKPYYESTGTTDYHKAQKRLRRRLSEIASGDFLEPKAERTTVEELAEDFLRDYRINARKSEGDANTRWSRHLKPFFGHLKAIQVTSDLINQYVDRRQQQGAANGSINRELAALKRMFHIAFVASPPKVRRIPPFPHLQERNVRTGFVEDHHYAKLAQECAKYGVWLRAMLEVGSTYGWREDELLKMKVKQIDLLSGTIRLEPGTTKNDEGREVQMTPAVKQLLSVLVTGKPANDFVFTRENGKPVRDFRQAWWTACIRAGLAQMVCRSCGQPVTGSECAACKLERKPASQLRYCGLIFHDLRRTAARNLRRAGVAEGVIMKIGGWRTRSVFERYAIVSQSDISDAMHKLETSRQSATGNNEQRQQQDRDGVRVNGPANRLIA